MSMSNDSPISPTPEKREISRHYRWNRSESTTEVYQLRDPHPDYDYLLKYLCLTNAMTDDEIKAKLYPFLMGFVAIGAFDSVFFVKVRKWMSLIPNDCAKLSFEVFFTRLAYGPGSARCKAASEAYDEFEARMRLADSK